MPAHRCILAARCPSVRSVLAGRERRVMSELEEMATEMEIMSRSKPAILGSLQEINDPFFCAEIN